VRRAIFIALLLTACSSERPAGPPDARPDTPSGSGARGAGGIEASPADVNLDLAVLGVSLVVAVPIGARRRK